MPQAITLGTSPAPPGAYGGSAPSASSLQAQLERYQKQLSDCVNCASAKTPQGKADIEAISARIGQVERQIAQVQEPPRSREARASGPSAAAPPLASGTYGGVVDVYA